MLPLFEWLLLAVALAWPFDLSRAAEAVARALRRLAVRRALAILAIGAASFAGCLVVATIVHEPVPMVHDEFSYLLLSNTLASGHLATPAPPLPAFFDSFHVLVAPVYASKYFPAQGLVLAIGERITGHPAVGVWIGSALACAATGWMLQAWIGPLGGLVGGLLMVVEWGVFSYWSQTYWGGMVAALGGALVFGAARRLWDRLAWRDACWLGVGLAIIATSRPAEGLVAVMPVGSALLWRVWSRPRAEGWTPLLRRLVLPVAIVLVPAAIATGVYDRAITGSAWMPPYALHEMQYQESPQLTLLPITRHVAYSSYWVAQFYAGSERRLYDAQQGFRHRVTSAAPTLLDWWQFFGGVLLGAPLVLAGFTRGRVIGRLQAVLAAAIVVLAIVFTRDVFWIAAAAIVVGAAQAILLWWTLPGFWTRLALVTGLLLLPEAFVVKWFQPHYFAPAAPLVILLQAEALRRLWHVRSARAEGAPRTAAAAASAADHARAQHPWRAIALLLPIACALFVAIEIAGRATDGWDVPPRGGAAMTVLPDDGWSLHRAALARRLAAAPAPSLVFVRYASSHNVNFEWVFNHADVVDQYVIWARDLGPDRDRQLIARLPGRAVWAIDADDPDPDLEPYDAANSTSRPEADAPQTTTPTPASTLERTPALPW